MPAPRQYEYPTFEQFLHYKKQGLSNAEVAALHNMPAQRITQYLLNDVGLKLDHHKWGNRDQRKLELLQIGYSLAEADRMAYVKGNKVAKSVVDETRIDYSEIKKSALERNPVLYMKWTPASVGVNY
jgi:hypothetical protein